MIAGLRRTIIAAATVAYVAMASAVADWTTFEPSKTTWGLLAYGKFAHDNVTGITPTATAAYGGSSSKAIGMLQALLPGFWGYLMRSKGKAGIRYYG